MKTRDFQKIVLVLLVFLLSAVAVGSSLAADVIPIRLVALIDRDDQGESISFPYWLHYDYWASETYLLSSNNRITIYDQKYFPVASFGKGRGLGNPIGITVDRRGNIYICQYVGAGSDKSRLTIYNQAFFPVKEIEFAKIPELAEFSAQKVAVAENGDIYLVGNWPSAEMGGVAVLGAEGNFLRILHPPEKTAWRPAKKVLPAENKDNKEANLPESGSESAPNSSDNSNVAAAFPAGLKPKPSSRAVDADEDQGQMDFPYISDVKIDRQGRIYLLSREVSNIYVLNAKEEYLFKFGEKGGAGGKLSTPVSMGIDLERRVIYVCDYMRHTILCYDYDSGRFIFEFGGQGVGPLWFNFPNSIDVDQRGRVIVSDLFNRRLQVIDPSIGERRPLTGKLGGLVQVLRPAEEEPAAVAMQPEIAAPPPKQALLGIPAGGSLPVGVVAPRFPASMAGVTMSPVRIPLLAVNAPPAGSVLMPVRELVPRRLKKVLGPPLQMAKVAPVHAPALIPRAAAVRFAKTGGRAPAGRIAAEPLGILARFRAMPAAVGVYGPVAALVGVGSWLLYTNR